MSKPNNQTYSSAGTSLNQVPAAFRKISWQAGTCNVDIGGGRFDAATQYLATLGVENLVYDPYNRSQSHNDAIVRRISKHKADTATVCNVLNVIDSLDVRLMVIQQAASAIKPSGTAYFSVYEGDKSGVGKKSKADCWQNNRVAKTYLYEISRFFDFASLRKGVITATNPKEIENVWALGKLPRWYNSGYDERDDGTFISVNAKYAEEEGRFSAGTFRTRYSVSKKAWTMLIRLAVIKNTEWHHTGKDMRKTEYYAWGDYNVCDYTQGTVDEGSFGDIYLNNKKTIDKLTDKFEEADWEYEEEKATKYVTTIDGYIEISFQQRKDDYLSDEEKDNRTKRHNFISDGGWEIGTSFERKLMHEEVDKEFDEIAKNRFDKDLPKIKAEYEQQYGAIIKENEEINKHNASIREKNAHTKGKERAMLDILDLFGYEKESAISKVTILSALALAEKRKKQKYENGKVIAEDYKKRLVALAKREKTWFDKKIKEGSIVYRERIKSEPEFFVKTLEEMHGKYGWFEASYRYNLPTYYSGYAFDTKTLYNKYLSFNKERANILEEAQKNGATMEDLWSLKGIGTVEHNNAYYRARIAAIQKLQDTNPNIKKFLQNGFIPADRKDSFEKYIQEYVVDNTDNSPLTFTELMTYNTWYAMHPEKVAGKMEAGSSLYFPVVVKGTKQDVEKMFEVALRDTKKSASPKHNIGERFTFGVAKTIYTLTKIRPYDELSDYEKAIAQRNKSNFFYYLSDGHQTVACWDTNFDELFIPVADDKNDTDDEISTGDVVWVGHRGNEPEYYVVIGVDVERYRLRNIDLRKKIEYLYKDDINAGYDWIEKSNKYTANKPIYKTGDIVGTYNIEELISNSIYDIKKKGNNLNIDWLYKVKNSNLLFTEEQLQEQAQASMEIITEELKLMELEAEALALELNLKERNDLYGIDNNIIEKWLNPADITYTERLVNTEESTRLKLLQKKFGNKLQSIAKIPYRFLPIIGIKTKDNSVYCSKAYFLNHLLHHTNSTKVSDYLNIPNVLFNPDNIIETSTSNGNSYVFVKRDGRFKVAIIALEKEHGKIILHKSFFVQQKKPYKNVARLFEILPEDERHKIGIPSIVRTL